jgi:hypothetical protein
VCVCERERVERESRESERIKRESRESTGEKSVCVCVCNVYMQTGQEREVLMYICPSSSTQDLT